MTQKRTTSDGTELEFRAEDQDGHKLIVKRKYAHLEIDLEMDDLFFLMGHAAGCIHEANGGDPSFMWERCEQSQEVEAIREATSAYISREPLTERGKIDAANVDLDMRYIRILADLLARRIESYRNEIPESRLREIDDLFVSVHRNGAKS